MILNIFDLNTSSEVYKTGRSCSKMSEKYDTTQNITKLSYPGENLGFTTEIDGRENKEDFLTFPFDHMYACNSDNSDLNSERQANDCEVRQLKELLMLHLDLIQQQSEEIVNKDKYIAQLRQENDMLKQRIERMERRVSLKNNTHLHTSNNNDTLNVFSDSMTQDSGFCADTEESKEKLKIMGLCDEEPDCNTLINNVNRQSVDRDSNSDIMGQSDKCFNSKRIKNHAAKDTTCTTADIKIKHELSETESSKLSESNDAFPDSTTLSNSLTNQLDHNINHVNRNNTESRQFSLRLNTRRKRLCSNSSQFSTNESLSSAVDEQRKSENHRKKRKSLLKRTSIVTTDQPFVTVAGETFPNFFEEQDDLLDVHSPVNLEVPRWRVKLYTSCYSMEGTENLDDEVYNKRHLRLENDERRRKRWDVQRIREQRHIERLKQRQDRIASGKSDGSSEPLASFWPSLEDVRYIEVSDELPVSAFGAPIPKLTPSEFSLPWLNGAVPVQKPQTRKSTARRRQHKR